MQAVKDIQGEVWYLDLTLGNAEEVGAFLSSAYGVDIFDAVATMGILSRPINVVSVASCLCRPQREHLEITPEEFGKRWKGAQAYDLQQSLWKEYRDFFPSPEIQELLSSMMTQLQSLSVSEGRLVKNALDKLAHAMAEAVDEMRKTIGEES